ncbi:MAG: asparagine synthetase B [Gemmatimonadota bacterium]|nr:MAG: asparagine synthetase B [Gemmatimonadota bacterium]
MCGIAGIVDGKPVRAEDLRRMTDALAHRGPDDQGAWIDGGVGLGHRRLSIIGLEDGHQPMSNEDDSVHITFNGEIYNYKELRKTLPDTHDVRTSCDTEMIVHLYEELGEKVVTRLRGMFGFAIWDAKRRKLMVARDHLGQKPLYYVHDGGRFAFASEIKGLLALDPSLRELDEEALWEYLTIRVITPPRSMFRRIRKLPPGHLLVFENGQVRVEPFWQLNFEPKRNGSDAELLDELDAKVQESVRYHLVSDVPVGAFLSGGFDSSIIVGMMAGITKGPFKTFTGDIRYGDYSEAPYADLVSDRYGTEKHRIEIRPSFVRTLPEVVEKLDEPSDPLALCLYHLAEMTRKEVKVVLGGDGGDELFGGYDRYYGNVTVNYYAMIPEFFRRSVMGPIIDRLSGGNWYRSVGHKLKWMQSMSFHEGGERYARSLGYFYFSEPWRSLVCSDAFQRRAASFDPEYTIKYYFDADNAKEAVDRMLHSDSRVRMPDHPVMILDRMTMAHGLEARCPFLDHELAEFCASLRPDLKVRGRELRWIEKRLAERYVPPEILNRKKQGFSSPLTYLLADEFQRMHDVLLRDASLVRDGYLDAAGIETLLTEHLEKRRDHGQRLWLLCTAEIWYRLLIEEQDLATVQAQLAGAAPVPVG